MTAGANTGGSAGGKGQRVPLSFSVDGMPAREELLLKSLVRLLDHRTRQHWSWKVVEADLRIVGENPKPAGNAADRVVPTLTVGQADPQQGPFLPLPLHADELENMLNRLGALIIHARGLGLAAPGEPAEVQFRLLRWPPTTVLDTPLRVRLATILASRPASLATLQQRAATSAEECAEFVAELQRAGYVDSNGPASTPRTGARSGAASSAAPQQASAVAPRDTATVPAGLLARIRNRLGLPPATAR